MSDIIGETDGLGLVLYSGTRDELQAKLRKRDDEITRLRSLLKEAGDALEPIAQRWIDPLSIAREHWQRARTILSKIKGEA